MSPQENAEQKTVVSNRRARHDFEILERYETGIVLTGAEVKSLRGGRGSLAESFARVRGGEIWLEGMHIPPYEQAMDKRTYDPIRPRKLLLHRAEIQRLIGAGAAILFLFGLKVAFVNPLYGRIQFVPWVTNGDVVAVIPWLLIAGAMVAVLAGLVGMRRFLDV